LDPLVERLEDEEGVKVARLEVWHNEANAKLMRSMTKGIAVVSHFSSIRRRENGFAGQQIMND
jgi:hypothetical protein